MTTRTGVAGRVAVVSMVAALLLSVTGCLSDQLYTTDQIPKSQAAQQLDATFTHVRIPASFVPLAATVSTATWGAQARTVQAAFTTTRGAFDQFMATIATKDAPMWLYDTSGSCPLDTTMPTVAITGPPDELLNDWFDRGIFQRCKMIESWLIARTEFRDTVRSTGRIFVQPSPTAAEPDQVTVLILSSIA